MWTIIKDKLAYLVHREILALLMLDCLLLPLALVTAVELRLGGDWDARLNHYWWLFYCLPLWTVPLFIQLGLYRAIIKFLDYTVVYIVVIGVSVSVLILTVLIHFANALAFPRTAIIIYWLFALVYIGGSRFILRGLLRKITGKENARRVAIYGAGSAGIQLASSLILGCEYAPLFFIDDDGSKWHKTIRGLKVYSPRELLKTSQVYQITEVLLAIPSASLSRRREIIETLQQNSIYVKTLPGIAAIISGEVKFSDIKEVDIEDLLGRLPVSPAPELLAKNIVAKVVLVTGAGGSIGSELCRQIAAHNPARLIILDAAEFALYNIEQELRTNFAYINVTVILASVTNGELMSRVIEKYEVKTIYHAAAYKHVPLVEANPLAGIANNALGTLMVTQAALQQQVENMVLISTDKAVRPTNVMGASKRLAELIVQGFAATTPPTVFNIVRFGNVLGSSGSVVPLFKRQLKAGGPITVTHPDIMRYFMTIPEAVQLVIQAGTMAQGGEVFVLDMGAPVKIVDLARKMIYLSGLTVKDGDNPHGDIEIKFTGLRPGEKLYEELLIGDNSDPTAHQRILKANETFIALDLLNPKLLAMSELIRTNQVNAALDLLKELVPEYTPAIK